MPLQLSCPTIHDCGSRPSDSHLESVEVQEGDVLVLVRAAGWRGAQGGAAGSSAGAAGRLPGRYVLNGGMPALVRVLSGMPAGVMCADPTPSSRACCAPQGSDGLFDNLWDDQIVEAVAAEQVRVQGARGREWADQQDAGQQAG